MTKTTITDVFDLPFRRVRQNSDPTYYAVGTLRLEPIPSDAVEYVVALPGGALPPQVIPSFVKAVGDGVRRYASEHGVVGVRVTLISIAGHDIDSSDYSFSTGIRSLPGCRRQWRKPWKSMESRRRSFRVK